MAYKGRVKKKEVGRRGKVYREEGTGPVHPRNHTPYAITLTMKAHSFRQCIM